jgi:DNA-binding NtrC family response regulator
MSGGRGALPDLAGVRVVLVDDHADTLEVYGAYLRLCGAEVSAAESARRAAELLDRVDPSVVVSDLTLGDDLAILAERVRDRGLPAIAVTGWSKDSTGVQGVLDVFAIVLLKPVLPEDLCAAIQKVLASRA